MPGIYVVTVTKTGCDNCVQSQLEIQYCGPIYYRMNPTKETTTNSLGQFNISNVDPRDQYKLVATATGYFDAETVVTTMSHPITTVNMAMQPAETIVYINGQKVVKEKIRGGAYMANRAGVPNHKRFPYRFDESTGMPLCRVCGKLLNDKRRTFCGPRCVRDFMMKTDWSRVRRVIYERDGGICMKCGQPVSKDDFHVDHIVPICAGGDEWDLSNLELSCPKCNLQKGGKVG